MHVLFGILNSVRAHQVSLAGRVINNNPEFGNGRIVNAAVAENAPRSIVLGILIKYLRPLRIGQLPAFLVGCQLGDADRLWSAESHSCWIGFFLWRFCSAA